MRFEAPWAFLLLAVIPALIFWRLRAGRLVSLRFSSTAPAKAVPASLRQRLRWFPVFLRMLVLALLIVALSRPQQGREKIREVNKGIAIEMVVDRSGSMGAEMDFDGKELSRLDVVKRVFLEFIGERGGKSSGGLELSGRPNDLIGMIAFARYADTICPLTLAHDALKPLIESLQVVKRQDEDGTAIGDAIALAAARLKTAEETLARQTQKDEKQFEIKSKIMILLTDGQNNIGLRTPQQAAALAKDWGIKIYAIGVGGEQGRVRQQGLLGAFMLQADEGVDQKTLKSLADSTGGIFRMAEDGEALRSIYREIDRLERSEVESVRYLDYRELFWPFMLAALALLLLEVALSCTVFRKIP